jgi:hypothetical protein
VTKFYRARANGNVVALTDSEARALVPAVYEAVDDDAPTKERAPAKPKKKRRKKKAANE